MVLVLTGSIWIVLVSGRSLDSSGLYLAHVDGPNMLGSGLCGSEPDCSCLLL
jgi:hypothetical protein